MSTLYNTTKQEGVTFFLDTFMSTGPWPNSSVINSALRLKKVAHTWATVSAVAF